MSRRDLAHVMTALWRLSGDAHDAAVSVDGVDAAIGRGSGDMRTPLHLQALADDGLVAQQPDGGWALTPQGIAWVREDRELSGR